MIRFTAAVVLTLVLHTGILTAQSDSEAFLNNCVDEGRKAGEVASRGACAGLLNKCPVPAAQKGARVAQAKSADERFQAVLDKTCDVLFTEQCKNAGTSQVFRQNFSPQGCGAILERGPGMGAKDCPDRETAVSIFSDLLNEICETTAPPTGSKEILLSRGKRTLQSSTGSGGTSNKAVDGNKNSDFKGGSCTHTAPFRRRRFPTRRGSARPTIRNRRPRRRPFPARLARPWWSVDLGSPMKITRVEITNRSDCCGDRLDNFEILVGNIAPSTRATLSTTPCASGLSVPTGETVSFDCSATGQYVTIRLQESDILTLCEVEVFGQ